MVAAAIFAAWAATCAIAGWLLSMAGWLGRAGWAGVFALFVFLLAVMAWRNGGRVEIRWRRWRRGGPAAFLILWGLATLGGALHPPSNIDALTYRLPRVLHWLSEGGWHWLDSEHLRMNYSATGAEWLAAPVLALAQSARGLFLINAVGFLLLPGLVFVALRGLGATGRAAWRAMWVTPTALGLALQAGSLGNDLLGFVYLVAVFAFAARAEASGRATWWSWAVVALGLATGVKASNLALVPAGGFVLWRVWRARRGTWRRGVAVMACGIGILVTSGPTLVLNAIHSGHWSGDPENATGVRLGDGKAGIAGNAAMTIIQNVAPPVFPTAQRWNRWSEDVLSPWWREHFGEDGFPRMTWRLGELPQEEWAGLGLCFLLFLAAEGWCSRRNLRPIPGRTRAVLWLGGAGVAVYCATMGSEMPARLLLPFYFLLIAAVMVRVNVSKDGRRWRAVAAGLAFATAMGAVIVTPARPLFPVRTVMAWVEARWPDSATMRRAAKVYEVYGERGDMLREIRTVLRDTDTTIAFLATDDDSEWSLWQPLGTRRVVHVRSLADSRLKAASVLVARTDVFWRDEADEEAALQEAGFAIEARREITVKASRPAERWVVARKNFQRPAASSS